MDAATTNDLPTSAEALVFPSAAQNWSRTLSDIKQRRLSIRNRLASILADADYAQRIAETYALPLVANERCGSWYVPPERRAASVYFKSTDGHAGQWSFSLRRLNLHLLEVIEAHNGGKKLPDALVKTVPIWAAVINMLLFPSHTQSHRLHTPAALVSRSEHAQIEARLHGFVERARTLGLDLNRLRSTLSRPLLPVFACQDDPAPVASPLSGFLPVICCSVSRQEAGDGDPYVQGSGDDTENWARGLTADLFWRHREQLCSEANDELLEALIDRLSRETVCPLEPSATLIEWTSPSAPVSLSTTDYAIVADRKGMFDAIISCNTKSSIDSPAGSKRRTGPLTLHLGCRTGKLGSRDLRAQLPLVSQLMRHLRPLSRILVSCRTGDDLAVGVALNLLCQRYDDDGHTLPQLKESDIDKTYIRQRMARILESKPDAKPSRATLQAVHSFLMSRPS